jgi:hypothetical protein
MPRLRIRLPITVDVTEEELTAIDSVRELVSKAKSVGLVDACSDAVKTVRKAVERRRRR